MKARYRRSKRFTRLSRKALAFLLVSAFFVAIIPPIKAYALSDTVKSEVPIPPSLIVTAKTKRLQAEEIKQIQTVALDVKKQEVEVVQLKANKVAEEKAEVESTVQSLEKEIEELKAKIAEKKRLEALRIVPASASAPDSQGNNYALGNCTYYVKNKRPDLPNTLGNANTWFKRAQSLGYKTGTMAKAGAVGTTTRGKLGHVVYVEKWLGNGKILISEMNVNGLWSLQTRTADESEFVYIYELNI